jgi:hypothetical protein
VTVLFSQAISGGGFDTALNTAASQFNAVELLEENAQHDSSEPVTPPTYTEVDTQKSDKDGDASLNAGEFAGIIVGVLVGFGLIMLCMYAVAKRRNKDNQQMVVVGDYKHVTVTGDGSNILKQLENGGQDVAPYSPAVDDDECVV